ncbi:MAG: acetyl-coenzyme A synthetase N-terminal domain-containing protein, partial [Geminicoccaceae bacterium]
MADQVFPVLPDIAAQAHLTEQQHCAWTERAKSDPDGFWREQAGRLAWIKQPTKILSGDFTGDVRITWYEDGTLNASAT